MSRHQFPGLDGASTVFIGWDRPMQTFFVQVLRPHPHLAGEEETVAWHGTAIGELANAREAVTIASRWARLPSDLAIRLETDRLKTAHALETVRTGVPAQWVNPDTRNSYTVVPERTYEQAGTPCREYTVDAVIGGKKEKTVGTACRQADGSWRVQS